MASRPDTPAEEAPPRAPGTPERARRGGEQARTMLPGRAGRRLAAEAIFMRLVATSGVVGIGVGLGAILVAQDVAGWIVGLAVSLTSVILAGILWSSRQL